MPNQAARVRDAKILVVDDEEMNVRLLEKVLDGGGFSEVRCVTDPREVVSVYDEWRPDIVLLDLHMPHMDGFDVMGQLALWEEGLQVPILVLTADVTPEAKERALSSGAKDFLTKPFDRSEVILRTRNLLETRFLQLELSRQNQVLEEKVRLRTREVEESRLETLERLALAAEFRDDDTNEHTRRVGQMSAFLARALGLRESRVELIRRAAPLHDIGKIGIPDAILLKPGKLTADEFERMKTHTTIGGQILAGSRFATLRLARDIALTHHERWDGSGYPEGLAEDEIPLVGRIVSVADAFDAMTHRRPYKGAWPAERAIQEMRDQSGRQFDPRIVDAFVELWGGVVRGESRIA